MMQTDLSTTRTAGSATVRAKADHLAVAWRGAGALDVASGTRPGVVYHVQADRDPSGAAWTCSCEWARHGGSGCSHVRAAVRHVERMRRAAARAGA